jgi:hypothetical protein
MRIYEYYVLVRVKHSGENFRGYLNCNKDGNRKCKIKI